MAPEQWTGAADPALADAIAATPEEVSRGLRATTEGADLVQILSPEGVLTPGTFTYAAVNERHGPLVAEEETEFLFYTDGPFDYFIDEKGK